MPHLVSPIQEINTHIIDPVARELVNTLLIDLGLRDRLQDALYIHSDYKSASQSTDSSHRRNVTNDRVDVTVSANLDPNQVKWPNSTAGTISAYPTTTTHDAMLLPLFADQQADIYLYEYMIACSLNLEFTVMFQTTEEAYRLQQIIQSKYHGDGTPCSHTLSYSYPLDTTVALAFYQFYKLKNYSPNTLSYIEYLQKYSPDILKVDVSRDRPADVADAEVVFKRYDIGAVGVMEYTQSRPEAQLDEKIPDRYSITFSYTVQFARPNFLKLTYPCVVNNQLVPDWLIRTEPNQNLPQLLGAYQSLPLYQFARSALHQYSFPLYVAFPYYDDFQIPMTRFTSECYHPFVSAGVLLDLPATTTTVDLVNDFTEIKLHPAVLEMIRRHGSDIFDFGGLFNLTVFANDVMIGANRLSITPDLKVTFQATLPALRYHLVLSDVTDISKLKPKYLDLLLEYRWFFPLQIISNINRLIDNGYYTVGYDELTKVLDRCLREGKLGGFLAQLISDGHVTDDIYRFTITAWQLADYLCTHMSVKTGRYLYNELGDLGLAAGCIDHLPLPYISGPNGYPIGGSRAINSTLRIFDFLIVPTR